MLSTNETPGKRGNATEDPGIMSKLISDFSQIIAPMDPQEFFRDYFGQKPCFIPGPADKFESVMSWPRLNRILNQTSIWTSENLLLVMDKDVLKPNDYCVSGLDRREKPCMKPDPIKVMQLIKDGASLALNQIDTLDEGLRALSNALEERLFGKSQVNLYCSRRERQAFHPHDDSHDVFALHCEGEKRWTVYDYRSENPINHPMFKPVITPDHRDKLKGNVLMEPLMTPGDFLYIPRGQYHEALSVTDNCVHVACGVTYVIGMDLLSLTWEAAMKHPLFRANVPPNVGPRSAADQRAYLIELAKVMANTMASPEFQKLVTEFQRNYRNNRGGFEFPVMGPTNIESLENKSDTAAE
ncbi:MAG: JmjC domain-containing protein [Rhodospirillaceae bacterium]